MTKLTDRELQEEAENNMCAICPCEPNMTEVDGKIICTGCDSFVVLAERKAKGCEV